jgi:WD40 repeat protein
VRSAAQLLAIVLLIACPAVVCTGQEREIRSTDGQTLRTVELRDVRLDGITPLYPERPARFLTAQRGFHRVESLSPDGKLLATQGTYEPLILWDIQGRRILAVFGGDEDDGVSLAFSRDSRLLLSVTNAGAVFHKYRRSNGISVRDVGTLKELLHVRERQNTELNEVVLSPDGKMVMALVATKCNTQRISPEDRCLTDTIKLWDIERAKEVLTLKGQSAEFSQDGKSLLVNDSGRQTVLDIGAGRKERPAQPATPSRARALTFTADNVAKSIGDNKWEWTVFIKGDHQDIAKISCVQYTLHPTFPNPVRLICHWDNSPYGSGLSAPPLVCQPLDGARFPSVSGCS